MSPVAVSDALTLVHLELCSFISFTEARPTARMVVREGLSGRLRESVAHAGADLRDDARAKLQARIARLWCEVALDVYSPGRIRVWMHQQGYPAEEIELALNA